MAIVTENIEASLAFYRDALGLVSAGSISIPIGTLHRFRFGTSEIKLIEPRQGAESVSGPGATIDREPEKPGERVGYRHMTFAVSGLSALCGELAARKIRFAVAETEVRTGVRMAMAFDPDGNIVEFVEKA